MWKDQYHLTFTTQNTSFEIKKKKRIQKNIISEMEANKEQLITNIIADCDYIKQLLNENILRAAPISTLIKIARLLEETRNRMVEILSLEDEEEEN